MPLTPVTSHNIKCPMLRGMHCRREFKSSAQSQRSLDYFMCKAIVTLEVVETLSVDMILAMEAF